MNTLTFANADVIYKQVLKDIKVLKYSHVISETVCKDFDVSFKSHIDAIYNNSPRFFKDEFVSTDYGFKLYQKYYFLIYLINACLDDSKNSDYPKDYIEWASNRNYECISYLLEDPYPNEVYNPQYKSIYYQFITTSASELGFLLSTLKQVKDTLMKGDDDSGSSSNGRYPSDLILELTPKYLSVLDNDGNLIFDFTKFNSKLRNIGNNNNIKIDGEIPKPKRESLENIFNHYDSIELKSLTISNNIYGIDLSTYDKLYVVLSSVSCDSGYISGFDNVKGNIVFSGKFNKNEENGTLSFEPVIDSISYKNSSCIVKKLQLYITDESGKIIPYNKNFYKLHRSRIINMPFKLGHEGDLCSIFFEETTEWKYSIQDKVIKLDGGEGNTECKYCSNLIVEEDAKLKDSITLDKVEGNTKSSHNMELDEIEESATDHNHSIKSDRGEDAELKHGMMLNRVEGSIDMLPVVITSYNYVLCGVYNKTVIRFISTTDIDVTGEFTCSALGSRLHAFDLIGNDTNEDVYTLPLRKCTPTYYMYTNVICPTSSVFNNYICKSNIINESLDYNQYCKAVYLAKIDDEMTLLDDVGRFYYMLRMARQFIVYTEHDGTWEILSVNNEMDDYTNTYVKIYLCNEIEDTSLVDNTDMPDTDFHRITTQYGDIYVKVNEKFSLQKDGCVYVLREDGRIYQLSSMSTHAFYVKSSLEIYEINTHVYSNIEETIPEFKKGDRILHLTLADYAFEDDLPSYEIYKNDSKGIQFQFENESNKPIRTVCYAPDISKNTISCIKTETGLLKTDLKSNYTFENALDFEELEVFSDNAIDVILKLS